MLSEKIMSPLEALKLLGPKKVESMDRRDVSRIAPCYHKLESKLRDRGYHVSLFASNMHVAMIALADKMGVEITHNKVTDIVAMEVTASDLARLSEAGRG